MAFFSTVFAAEFTVDQTKDGLDKDITDGVCATTEGHCTLRAAIQQANARRGFDRIVIPEGIYFPSIGARGEDAAADGDLDILDDLTIVGAGAERTVLTGFEGRYRIFHVLKNSRVTIRNLTLTDGLQSEQGAVVYNTGSLALVNVTVTNAGADSSAIYNDKGILVISGSRISGNSQGIYTDRGEILIEGSEFSENVQDSGDGSAIYVNHGRITINNTAF